LVRLLVFSDSFNWLILLLLGLVFIWVWFRILRSTSVVYDVPEIKSYLIGTSVLIFFIGILLAIYQYKFSFFSYTQHFFNVVLNN
jgi:hypothetical protein